MKRSKRALGQARMRVAVGMFVGILIVVGALQASVVGERLNYSALDATQRLVRALAPRPALENIVIVGIDKGTERSFPEPFALWHRHLGEALSAIARGQPKLVALDIVLPERSYDALVPGAVLQQLSAAVVRRRSGRVQRCHPQCHRIRRHLRCDMSAGYGPGRPVRAGMERPGCVSYRRACAHRPRRVERAGGTGQ